MTSATNKSLTRREKEIAYLIASKIEASGYSPSYREMMQLLGLSSPATVHKHIQNIKRKGYLIDSPDARTLVVDKISPDNGVRTVPIIGSVARGQKLQLFPTISSCHVPASLIANGQSVYGFVAKDDSFLSEHIMQGDLLLVETRSSAQPGELVLLVIDTKETELAHYVERGENRVFMVSDDDFDPLNADDAEIQIRGIVIALFRALGKRKVD